MTYLLHIKRFLKAIKLNKPRWLLAHDHVVFAWSLLKNLKFEGKEGRKNLKLKKTQVFDDLRVLDLYEEAIVDGIPLADRKGNWVQKFDSNEDGSRFVAAQFFRYQEVEEFIKDNFENNPLLSKNGGDV